LRARLRRRGLSAVQELLCRRHRFDPGVRAELARPGTRSRRRRGAGRPGQDRGQRRVPDATGRHRQRPQLPHLLLRRWRQRVPGRRGRCEGVPLFGRRRPVLALALRAAEVQPRLPPQQERGRPDAATPVPDRDRILGAARGRPRGSPGHAAGFPACARMPQPPRRKALMKFSSIVFAGCLVLASATAIAQEGLRIGFVDIERLRRDAAPAKTSQQKLEREFSSREKELQDISAKLKSMGERIDRDAAVLSESDRMRLRREYADLEKDFQRKQREFREDLNQRRNEELAQVIEQANRAIKDIAEKERYDLILQEAVTVSPRIDITEKVLRALGGEGGR